MKNRSFRVALLCSLVVGLAPGLSGCQRDVATTAAKTPAESLPAAAVSPPGTAAPKALVPLSADPDAAPSLDPSAGQLPVLEILSEGGDLRDGLLTVDAYEGDRLWMGVMLGTEAGAPLSGKTVRFAPRGNALSPPPQIIAAQPDTDTDGYMEFQVIVGDAGTFPVTVSAAGVQRDFQVNVVPNDFDQWLQGVPQEGLLPWNTLMKTRVALDDAGMMVAEYPDDVVALEGQTVRLAGFMLPLDMTPEQRHFLLAASPPACFFHVPGGPATVIEVFAGQHPVMGTLDPLVVEGRLELVKRSEEGVLFKLQSARMRDK